MRPVAPLLSLMLVGCGVSEDEFQNRYGEKYCDQQLSCVPESECDYAGYPDPTKGCDYDPAAAKDCLKDEWTCNVEFDPVVFPESAKTCDDVYVCPKGGN